MNTENSPAIPVESYRSYHDRRRFSYTVGERDCRVWIQPGSRGLFTVHVEGGDDPYFVQNPRPISGFRDIAWRKVAAIAWAKRCVAARRAA
jgi:hypothetical protein